MVKGAWFELKEGLYYYCDCEVNCKTGTERWLRRFGIRGGVKRFRVVFSEGGTKGRYSALFDRYHKRFLKGGLYPPYLFRCGVNDSLQESVRAIKSLAVHIEYERPDGTRGRRKLR